MCVCVCVCVVRRVLVSQKFRADGKNKAKYISLLLDTTNQSILKEIDQSWVFTGRTDAEAETPVLWPPHAKS